MKITVYELLGMIKDGKAPKKVLYIPLDGCEYIFTYDEAYKDYFDGDIYLSDNCYQLLQHLNDKVEIIEDNQDIKEIQITRGDNCQRFIEYDDNTGHHKYNKRGLDEYLATKINEVIKEVNKQKNDEEVL